MQILDLGTPAVLTAKATKRKDGKPASPTDYYWKVVPPKGDPAHPTVKAEGEGEFSGEYEGTVAGTYHYLFLAKAGDKVAGEGQFRYRTPKVPRD